MKSLPTMLMWCVVAGLGVFLMSPQAQLQVHASEVATGDGFTLLTGQSRDPRASGGQELVYVIDHRSGMLLVYGLQHDGSALRPVMLDGGPVSALFSQPAPPSAPQVKSP
jgi:hypothetical protein